MWTAGMGGEGKGREERGSTVLLSTSVRHVGCPLQKKNKLHGLSPRANYTDRATAVCRRSDCQLLRIKGATWSA
jgi:hypothetical protein